MNVHFSLSVAFYYVSPTKLLKVFILSQSHICTVPPNSFSFLRFSFICVYVHACVSMCEYTHLCVSACCLISLSDYLWITSPQITMQRLINTYESFAFSLGLFPTNFYNLINLIFPPLIYALPRDWVASSLYHFCPTWSESCWHLLLT